MEKYVGNSLQIRGAEKYILQDGKGDGMHFVYVRNGLGLEVWISVDRCADISRVSFKGKNIAYFSPCGYVSPKYYDKEGAGFLKSFTAGFFTTCGLTAVGSPCVDNGEALPLHGTISNTPAVLVSTEETKNELILKFIIKDCSIFADKLVLTRTYTFSYTDNSIALKDAIENKADTESPYMIMYHCNMGYPLVQESSIINIPNDGVTPRNQRSAKEIEKALIIEKPQANYEECCFYYDVKSTDGISEVGIFNPDEKIGVTIQYNKKELPFFTEWKLMSKGDYVIGLEPANCTPDGRDVMRKNRTLAFIHPREIKENNIKFLFHEAF